MSSPPLSGLFYWAHDMTQFVIANNVNTQLAASAASGAPTLTLASSANLPTLSAGQVMPLTLNDAATGQNYEIVYVTAISGVTLTVTRAQEGTGALNWSIGDYAYCAPTAGTVAMTTGNPSDTFQVAAATALNNAPQAGQVQRAAFNYAGLAGGTANAITATLSLAPTSYTDYLIVTVRVASNNTGSVSLNVNGLGAVPVIGQGHQTLQGGELVAGGFATFAYSTNYNEAILLEATGGPVQVAPATASQHAPQAGQVQRNAFNYASAAGGTANALTATLTPAPASYTDDLTVIVRVASNNTGTTTLNVNGLGATTVVGSAHQALQGGELVAGGFACFAYSQALSQFVLLWATGGAEQVGTASQSNQAVTLGQLAAGTTNIGNRASFTSSGSFTVPANVSTLWYSGTGGGGGGGGGGGVSGVTSGYSATSGGGGGQAGQFARRIPITVTPGQTLTITIGAGGTAGTAGTAGTTGGNGGNGGNTTVTGTGVSVTLTGGTGGHGSAGVSSSNNTVGTIGSAGGAGADDGFYGIAVPSSGYDAGGWGGRGGNTPFGTSGGSSATGTAGRAGVGYGAGGSGGAGTVSSGSSIGYAGAAGLSGYVEFEW